MTLTRTPLKMLDARGSPNSDVTFNGKEVVVEDLETNNKRGIVSGHYDDATGTVTLELESGQKLSIHGFITTSGIGKGPVGPVGPKGDAGQNGIDGRDGETGPTGCQGPPGTPGRQGVVGPPGPAGQIGPKGETGPTGPKGDDGIVQVYIQTNDPGAPGAGSIWVKP